MPSLADTCQVVCMGPEQLNSAVSGSFSGTFCPWTSGCKGIMGQVSGSGIFITIMGVNTSQKKWCTKQLCFITEGMTRIMLSKEVCIQLRIINSSFSNVGSTASSLARSRDPAQSEVAFVTPWGRFCYKVFNIGKFQFGQDTVEISGLNVIMQWRM